MRKNEETRPYRCREFDLKLEGFADGRLSPGEMAACRAHLDDCASCRRRLQDETQWLSLLQISPGRERLSPAEAAVLRQAVYQRIRRRMIMRQTKWTLQSAAAVLAVILAVGLLVWWQQNGDWNLASDEQAVVAEQTAVITVAGSASFAQVYEQLGEQFTETHPHIQVQYVPLDNRQATLPMREQAALADVLLLDGWPPPAEAAAAFLDLAPLLAADLGFDPADFWPGIMDACQAAGVQVGVPFRGNASLIFYDKAAFDVAGLPYPAPGWTWADFQQAAPQLAARDGEQTTRYAFADAGNPPGLLAPLVDGVIGQSGDTLDGSRLAAQLAWYVSLAEQGIIAPPTENTAADHHNLINNRQTAMWLGSLFALASTRARLGDDLGVVSFPVGAGGASNPVTAGCALISAGTAQRQAAWTWLDYLSRQPLFTAGTLPVAPARPSVAESSDYWSTLPADTAAAVRSALEQGWYRRAEMPELAAVGEALDGALRGEVALLDSLPTTVEIQPAAPPPPPDSTPVAVATPRAVPTRNPDVVEVAYDLMPHHHEQERDTVAALARSFNESQDRFYVNTSLASHWFGSGTSLDLIDLAAGSDCFMAGYWPARMAERHGEVFFDALYSLQPLFDAEDAAFQDDFPDDYLEMARVNGELYALPVSVRPIVIEYNAGLLARRRLDPPAADWTVEDFWALAQAAGGGANYGFVLQNLNPEELLRFVPGGKHYLDFDTRPMRPLFTDPAVVGALAFLGRMAEEDALFPQTRWAASRSWDDDMEIVNLESGAINFGRAAMWVNRAGTGPGGSSVTIGVAPYPQSTMPNYFTQAGGGDLAMLYISRHSPDPSACWEWFKVLTSEPDVFRGVPLRQSVRQSAPWLEAVGEEAAAAYEIMFSWPRERLPDIGLAGEVWAYRTWWADALVSVFAGADAAMALAEAQHKAERFYDCYAPIEEPDFGDVYECARQADPDFKRYR
jgi:ABC-type glycerol-3-phosphate transport system substrate-binding protein